jgi:hypothetical protein
MQSRSRIFSVYEAGSMKYVDDEADRLRFRLIWQRMPSASASFICVVV